MFRHFLNTALRHFRKDWLYTLINVIGLTLGLALVYFIILYVSKEYSWNTMHEYRNSSYRMLVSNPDWTEPLAAFPLGPALEEDLPEVMAYSRIGGTRMSALDKNEREIRTRAYGADQGIFDILTFNILRGDRDKLLASKEDAVISKQLADVLYPDENPLGKELRLTARNVDLSLTISGVFENQPSNSTFRPDLMYSIEWAAEYYGTLFQDSSYMTNFRTGTFQTYFRLKDGITQKDFQKKLKLIEDKYYSPDWRLKLGTQKVADIYLHSNDLGNPRTATGDPKMIRIFSLVAVLILLIATFNYIILASARSSARFREIGLRKVTGASGKNISSQVFGESLITSLFAFPFSILLVVLFIPTANRILGSSLEFHPADTPMLLPGFLLVCIIVGLLSGLYLAVYLSHLRPVEIFRKMGGLSSSKSFLYKILVTMQILIFISLFTCSNLILKQVSYAENLDQGFNREDLLMINIDQDQFPSYEAFAQEIRKIPSVVNAGIAMGGPPTEGRGIYRVKHFQNPDEQISVEGLDVGGQYLETMEFRLVSGRLFNEGSEADRESAAILNETAIKDLGIEGDPLGQEIAGHRIIGVIKDFYIHSVKSKISPLVINYGTTYCYEVAVRIVPGQFDEALEQIKNTWKEMAPEATFSAVEFNQAIANMYSRERDFAFTIMGLTGLAVFIAVLGLFGLSLLLATKRTREVGIRKIHGASVLQIIQTINKSFIIYTLTALILSIPITIWIISKWLQNFEYKTSIGIVPFLISGLLALVVVILTVSYHAWRSARMNPAEVIKCE